MNRAIEYVNPNSYPVQLIGQDRRQIIVPANSRIVLSEWFIERYVPKYLNVVRVIGNDNKPIAQIERSLLTKPQTKSVVAPQPLNAKLISKDKPKLSPIINPNQAQTPAIPKPQSTTRPRRRHPDTPPIPQPKLQNRTIQPRRVMAIPQPKAPIVPAVLSRYSQRAQRPIGRSHVSGADQAFNSAYNSNNWAISNNIGIGILSFNRLESLKRLIHSIQINTDLSRVTVFVSDESTNPAIGEWLKTQSDIVVLTKQPRLGIAGNSNRLLRCLSRFKHNLLLNDDVEVLAPGWEDFYINAHVTTGYHHFCYKQIGLIGAQRGNVTKYDNLLIDTIYEKPHGAVMFFTHDAFRRVGYFDEQFGYYGMEHVDWSNRVGLSGLQPLGYHDIVGSEAFFTIHAEPSACADKVNLPIAKQKFATLSADTSRVFINASEATIVPGISIIVPVRNTGRDGAIQTVINSMRAQLFPVIDIIIIEQDSQIRMALDKLQPCLYQFLPNIEPNQLFAKSAAFNLGVALANFDNVLLHDADMIAPRHYVQTISEQLTSCEGIHIGKYVLYLNQESSTDIINTGYVQPDGACERVVDYYEGGSVACKRQTYAIIGGFNEAFIGYGVEDYDFFERLRFCSKFNNIRTMSLIHLWHGRVPGWEQHHAHNKLLKAGINKTYNINDKVADATPNDIIGLKSYAAMLSQQYKLKYDYMKRPN